MKTLQLVTERSLSPPQHWLLSMTWDLRNIYGNIQRSKPHSRTLSGVPSLIATSSMHGRASQYVDRQSRGV
jgi:hypothetical protein